MEDGLIVIMIHGRKSDIESLRARRDELVNLIERTRARVEAAEAAMTEADDFKEDIRRRVWEQEIHPSLGVVKIDCDGYLRDVQLDASAVRQSDTAKLGSRILTAIQEAEARAAVERKEGLEKIFRHVTTD